MVESIYSESHKRKSYFIIGVLFLILFLSVCSLIFGSKIAVCFFLGYIIVFLFLIFSPRWWLLLVMPIVFISDDVANETTKLLDQVTMLKGLAVVISTIGMVSFALTYINAARMRKVKGILMEDVINAFFPRYKWILVINGCLACLGRFACEVGAGACALLCFLGMSICICYMLHMANKIVFSEKCVWSTTSNYIKLVSNHYLRKEFNESAEAKFLDFISSIGAYIAQCYNQKEFSVSYVSCEEDVKSILPLIRHDNNPNNYRRPNIELDALYTFENGCTDFLQEQAEVGAYCHNCSVLRVPCTEWLRRSTENEMRISCSFWRSILTGIPDEQARVQAVCHILCTEHEINTILSGTLGCGLIMYLHYTYVPDMYPADKKGWENCMRFLYLMCCATNNATAGRNNLVVDSNEDQFQWVRKRCIDLFIILTCLIMIEQSCSDVKFDEKSIKSIMSAILWEEKEQESLSDERLDLCVYQAFLIYYALPVPVLSPKGMMERERIFWKVRNGIRKYCELK